MNNQQRLVIVCQHSSCKAQGSAKVLFAFQVANLPPDVVVRSTGCQGQCNSGPTVGILPEKTWYCLIEPQDVRVIVEQHLKKGNLVKEKLNYRIHSSNF